MIPPAALSPATLARCPTLAIAGAYTAGHLARVKPPPDGGSGVDSPPDARPGRLLRRAAELPLPATGAGSCWERW